MNESIVQVAKNNGPCASDAQGPLPKRFHWIVTNKATSELQENKERHAAIG
jgi:hypothetical protein